MCVIKLTIISSDNILSPGRRQAIIRANAANIINSNLRNNFDAILSEIKTLSFKCILISRLGNGEHFVSASNNKLPTVQIMAWHRPGAKP